MYTVSVLVNAMLYSESPLNYPDRFGRKDKRGNLAKDRYESLDIPAETARVIRETAWDILLTYPPAGIARDLVIADRRLPPVIACRYYEHRLKALNGGGTLRWTLERGLMPAGIGLSPDGILSGTSPAVGEFLLRVKVSDGKKSFERTLNLSVSEDRPPAIDETTLKPVALDDYCLVEIRRRGGVGPLKWDLAEGGLLMGTPGEAGEFRFTVRVTDSHPDGGRASGSR